VQRTAYHHGALADALTDEALAQVRAHGADHVSLRGIALAVGVSPSAAYHHFPDKSSLMAAVVARGFEQLAARMREGVAACEGDSDQAAVDRFEAVGRAYIGFAVDEPALFAHMVSGTSHPQEEAADSESYQMLSTALDELDARGLLRPGMRPGLELLAWTAVHGFSVLVLNGLLDVGASEQLVAVIRRAVTVVAQP